MTISLTNLSGPIYMPNGVTPFGGKVSFELTSWDQEPGEAVFVSGPIYADIDENGQFSVDLFTTTEGINTVNYTMYVHWYDSAGAGDYVNQAYQSHGSQNYVKECIGQFALSGEGPYQISDITILSELSVNSFDVLVQCQAFADQAVNGADVTSGNMVLARKWATEVEDVPVQDGGFSAYHHAQKSGEQASAAGTSAEQSATSAGQSATSAEEASISAESAAESATLAATTSAARAPGYDHLSDLLAETISFPDSTRLMAGGVLYKKISATSTAIEHYTTAANDRLHDPLARSETIDVGTGGDFDTLNEALGYFSERRKNFKQGNSLARIRLLSGFVMSEQVIVHGVDLGFVLIIAEDNEVTIDRSALTEAVDGPSYPAFYADGCSLPEIACQFVMDTSGTGVDRDGVVCANLASVRVRADCGVRNAGGSGLVLLNSMAATGDVDIDGIAIAGSGGANFSGCADAGAQIRNSSLALLNRADTSGSANGIFVRSNSTVDFWHGDASNCAGTGIRCRDSSRVNGRSANTNGCMIGVWASHIGNVNFRFGTANNCTGTGMRFFTGSVGDIGEATANGTLNTGHSDDDAGCGLSVSGGARVTGDNSATEIKNSSHHNVLAEGACSVSLRTADISGAGSRPVSSKDGARVVVMDAVADNCGLGGKASTGGVIVANNLSIANVASGDSFEVTNGGMIYSKGASGAGLVFSQPVNVMTSAGVIFGENDNAVHQGYKKPAFKAERGGNILLSSMTSPYAFTGWNSANYNHLGRWDSTTGVLTGKKGELWKITAIIQFDGLGNPDKYTGKLVQLVGTSRVTIDRAKLETHADNEAPHLRLIGEVFFDDDNPENNKLRLDIDGVSGTPSGYVDWLTISGHLVGFYD